MEKRNQKLTIIVGALLIVIGVSFSYFLATSLIKGNGASTKVTTARINGATLNVEGTLEFDDTGILPGHKNVSAIKLTATGNNQLIAYNLIWKGTNGISQINYTVYKSSTQKTISTNCSNKTSVVNGMQVLSEECSVNNIDTLGESIATGSIKKGDTKVTLAQDEFITATSDGQTVYYYIILEYPNLDIDQSNDVEATFNGEVTVEESDKKADINILAVYVADDSGNYTETTDIPQDGYILSEKSKCSNDATPIWDYENNGIIAANLTKSGTSCYLYFNKLKTVNTVLGNIQVNPEVKTRFDKVATTDEGIQQAEDGMYGGTSYYWRGAATTNYLKFAGYCWRIIRINGDGTLRLIYDGVSCHANAASTTESMAVMNIGYNVQADRSEYVGYTYEEGLQRPSNSATVTASNVKTKLEEWYNEYLTSYESKIASGMFCNDRNVETGLTWASQSSSTFNYLGSVRLFSGVPTLDCTNNDIYTLKVGIITADEIMYAGSTIRIGNTSFYLYNGQDSWTITPYDWYKGGWTAELALVKSGVIGPYPVNSSFGVRPVINLRSDITISSGDGTLDNPYIIAD